MLNLKLNTDKNDAFDINDWISIEPKKPIVKQPVILQSRASYFDTLDLDLIEVAVVGNGKMESVYFSKENRYEMFQYIDDYSNRKSTKAIYFNLHQINVDLFEDIPGFNKGIFKKPFGKRTLDADIKYFNVFPIDIDSVSIVNGVQKSMVNSTEAEKSVAREKAKEIAKFLRKNGIISFIRGDSGNGFSLLILIEPLLNSTENKSRFYDLGRLFNEKFDVDSSVYNAGRLWKVPDTWTRKGPNSISRPWRKSAILVPETTFRYKFDDLERKLGNALKRDLPKKNVNRTQRKISNQRTNNENGKKIPLSAFDSKESFKIWLEKDLGVNCVGTWIENSDYSAHSIDCPWNIGHSKDSSGGAYIGYRADKSAWIACQHNSCISEGRGMSGNGLQQLYEEKGFSKSSQEWIPKEEWITKQRLEKRKVYLHDHCSIKKLLTKYELQYELIEKEDGILYQGIKCPIDHSHGHSGCVSVPYDIEVSSLFGCSGCNLVMSIIKFEYYLKRGMKNAESN